MLFQDPNLGVRKWGLLTGRDVQQGCIGLRFRIKSRVKCRRRERADPDDAQCSTMTGPWRADL